MSNIYPTNFENFKAILDYYFSHLRPGIRKQLFNDIKTLGFRLTEIEGLCSAILSLGDTEYDLPRDMKFTQASLLTLAIQAFHDFRFKTKRLDKRKVDLVNNIRTFHKLPLVDFNTDYQVDPIVSVKRMITEHYDGPLKYPHYLDWNRSKGDRLV